MSRIKKHAKILKSTFQYLLILKIRGDQCKEISGVGIVSNFVLVDGLGYAISPIRRVILPSSECFIVTIKLVLIVYRIFDRFLYRCGWKFHDFAVIISSTILFGGVIDDGRFVAWKKISKVCILRQHKKYAIFYTDLQSTRPGSTIP